MHAVHRVVRGVAAGIIFRRPAPAAGIVQAQLPAFPQQSIVECLPASLLQAPAVHERRKEALQRHVRALSEASLTTPGGPAPTRARMQQFPAALRAATAEVRVRTRGLPVAPRERTPRLMPGRTGLP